MDDILVWILYFKGSERFEFNNPDGAAKIAYQLERLAQFFRKPNLAYGTEENIPEYGDENSTYLDMTAVMDNGKQFNLQVILGVDIRDL